MVVPDVHVECHNYGTRLNITTELELCSERLRSPQEWLSQSIITTSIRNDIPKREHGEGRDRKWLALCGTVPLVTEPRGKEEHCYSNDDKDSILCCLAYYITQPPVSQIFNTAARYLLTCK
jgi:hypothetical protein